ncbi:hypothetical protein [Pseudanabaena sp. FACHB-2040]|nr:hypothetical protein [Pseudanabaena sp. FACHB-2040]
MPTVNSAVLKGACCGRLDGQLPPSTQCAQIGGRVGTAYPTIVFY